MNKNIMANNLFVTPVTGYDPISKGKFIIEWAYMIWDDDWDVPEFSGGKGYLSRARGKIKIEAFNNPLFVIAKESPLRLQGLVASVDFGIEKRFIKIQTIDSYTMHVDMNLKGD